MLNTTSSREVVNCKRRDNDSRDITVVISSLRSGGAERVLVRLANEFAQRGFEVTLIALVRGNDIRREIREDIALVDFQSARVIHVVPRLVRHLRAQNPSTVICTQRYINVTLLAAMRLAGARGRVIVREGSLPGYRRLSGIKTALTTPITNYLARELYRYASCIVAVTDSIANDIATTISVSPKSISVISNPVSLVEINEKARKPATHPWIFPGQQSLVVGIGRLVKVKNFAMLLHAFAIVRKKHSAKLIILGEGDQRKSLERLRRILGLDDDVDFPGYVSNPYPYLRHAAVFALSSYREGLPNVLLEALVLGIPVVASDCASGPKQILAGGKYGALVPIDDHHTMAQKLCENIEGITAEKPPESYFSQYSVNQVVDRYELLCHPRSD